jgi:Cdc6-like AAA superfamily ATPase
MAKKETAKTTKEELDQAIDRVTAQPAQQPAPNLTLQDLVLVAQIIQLTTQRGAFKAEELADVGGLYNKLITFLQSTGALTPAAPTEETK